MYNGCHTSFDVMKEYMIYGAEPSCEMTHNNLLCTLSFYSLNLIFQLLNFFFLENDSILRSKIRIFTPWRSAGDVSRRAPDANAAR